MFREPVRMALSRVAPYHLCQQLGVLKLEVKGSISKGLSKLTKTLLINLTRISGNCFDLGLSLFLRQAMWAQWIHFPSPSL